MSERKPDRRLSILLTGNELLTGDITDTNSTFLSKALLEAGIETSEKVIVGDYLEDLQKALMRLTRENDVVLVNGGLGSTVDDLTAEVVSIVSGVPLVENEQAVEHIQKRFGKSFLDKNPQYFNQMKKQAKIPERATVIDNPVGIALGFKLKINRSICYFTPGVPREMMAMFKTTILPDILSEFQISSPVLRRHLFVTGVGESQVQHSIDQHIAKSVWETIDLGFRAGSHTVEVKLAARQQQFESLLDETVDKISALFPGAVFQYGQTLTEEVIGLLGQTSRRLAVAESCTGGLIASQITAIAGASDVFEMGAVTYSNESKMTLINVSRDLLEQFGAVSKEVAEEMVKGVLNVSNADYGLAVTGIAGPTGGSEEKPVGTVHIAWGNREQVYSRKLLIKQERKVFQDLVSAVAIDMIRRLILGLPTDGRYYFDELTRHRI